MNAEECNLHASRCAENAALCPDASVALEFVRLAAQWRTMALRRIFIGAIDDPVGALSPLEALPFAPAIPGRATSPN